MLCWLQNENNIATLIFFLQLCCSLLLKAVQMSKCFNFFSHVESPVMWAIGVIEICRIHFLTRWFLVVVMLSVFNIRQVIG